MFIFHQSVDTVGGSIQVDLIQLTERTAVLAKIAIAECLVVFAGDNFFVIGSIIYGSFECNGSFKVFAFVEDPQGLVKIFRCGGFSDRKYFAKEYED